MLLLLLACATPERRLVRKNDLREEYASMAELSRTPDRTIAILERTLTDGAEGELRATALLKLAEVHGEAYRQGFLAEMERYAQAYDSCFQLPGCEPEEINPDLSDIEVSLHRGIARLEQLHAEHPDFDRLDEVRYMLGWFTEDLGEHDVSIAHYTRLLAEHPDSAWAPDAWLILAEERFSEGRMAAAVEAYRAVIEADNGHRDYAIYKLAWCHFNLRDNEAAIVLLEDLLATLLPASTPVLRHEVLRDLVMFYAVEGDIERALVSFSEEPESVGLTERLGRLLMDTGKWSQGATVWTTLLAGEPMDERAPYWAQDRLRCGVKLGATEAARSELAAMRVVYGPGSDWAMAHPDDLEPVARMLHAAERLLP